MDLLLQVCAGHADACPCRNQTWFCLAMSLIICTGCGGSATKSAGLAEPDRSTVADLPMNPAAVDVESRQDHKQPATAEHGRGERWEDEKGKQWFGNVPMDAFFDQPYTVVSDATPIIGSPAVAAAVSDRKPADAPISAPTPARGDSWSDLISDTELDGEVKTIRNYLNQNLRTVSSYNAALLAIPPKAATLGALAGVAMEHPNAVSWKDDAKYVRDLAKKMNSDTLRSGPKDQKRLLELYEALSDTLNRSRPADLEEPLNSDGFADVSELRLLMHRIDEAEKRMKSEVSTAGALASGKEMVAHEAAVLATLAKIATLPGYGYEDDPRFKGYASDVIQAAMAIKSAAAGNDFTNYELALTKISTTCSACHSDYKNN